MDIDIDKFDPITSDFIPSMADIDSFTLEINGYCESEFLMLLDLLQQRLDSYQWKIEFLMIQIYLGIIDNKD